MSQRRDALRFGLAGLSAVAVIALGVRLAGQSGDLAAAKSELADAEQRQAALLATVAAGVGPPLLDASAVRPTEQLALRLRALGFEVQQLTLVAATPAGRGATVARFVVEGRADAAAIDRLSLWAQANSRSAILESLTATAGPDGKSDVRIELDAIVRVAPAVRPAVRAS
jgi:hypothetical protein